MDPERWSRLVALFGPVVYRWCRSSGVREADAPDLVQEVFSSVAKGIGRFQRSKEEGSFRSWLATVTRNKVRDHFRQVARQQVAAGGTAALQQISEQAEELESTICAEGAESSIMRQALTQVEAEFEPGMWRAFWLSAIDGKGAQEVAELTGLSTASVYQAKSRVLRRLRRYLSEVPG